MNNINECINTNNLNNILYVEKNTSTLNKIKSKSINKYKRIVTIGNTSIELLHKIKGKQIIITKRSKIKGRKITLTPAQAKENKRQSTNKSRVKNYAEKQKQYRKDIDKTLSQISNKKYSWILANFFAKHYQFNYFVTLTFNQIRFTNKEKITTEYEYAYTIEQDYIQNQKALTLEYVQQCVNNYLNTLKYKNNSIVDYYVVTFEKTIKGHWHAHIAIQISNTSKDYWSTFLTSRWNLGQAKTKKIRVDTPTKENTANVINYFTKDLEHKDVNVVHWDTNIDKDSKRIFTAYDLDTVEKIDYWLDTSNTLTVNKLLPHLPISNIKLTA